MFCHHQKGGDCWPKGHYPGYFDDSKTYLVMYLIILFKRISGSRNRFLTAPLKDSHIWSSPKICIPKPKHIGSFGNMTLKKRSRTSQDFAKDSRFVFLILFLDILSKLDIRSRAMGLSHTHTS